MSAPRGPPGQQQDREHRTQHQNSAPSTTFGGEHHHRGDRAGAREQRDGQRGDGRVVVFGCMSLLVGGVGGAEAGAPTPRLLCSMSRPMPKKITPPAMRKASMVAAEDLEEQMPGQHEEQEDKERDDRAR